MNSRKKSILFLNEKEILLLVLLDLGLKHWETPESPVSIQHAFPYILNQGWTGIIAHQHLTSGLTHSWADWWMLFFFLCHTHYSLA